MSKRKPTSTLTALKQSSLERMAATAERLATAGQLHPVNTPGAPEPPARQLPTHKKTPKSFDEGV